MKKHIQILIVIFSLPLIYCSYSRGKQIKYPDCNSSDIEKVDSCLLGKTINMAIKMLKLDTSQFFAFDEPPMILRGIDINLADTCEIQLFVERTSIIDKPRLGFRGNYKYIGDKKITGLSWRNKISNRHRELK